MHTSDFDRRSVVLGGGAWALLGALLDTVASPAAMAQVLQSQGDVIETIGADHVKRIAQQLSTRPFAKPHVDLPAPFDKLGYDQYRDIRFRREQAVWRGEKLDYELQLFPLGWLYDVPVEIWIVENGRARQLKADSTLFNIGPLIENVPQAAPFGFSGFRVHGPINRSDYLDEYFVFQGASYFRAVGRGGIYGLSARGLAINTARPGGEEFPLFRAFWIEKPKAGAAEIVIHALLDSPSTTGAYRFAIQPGQFTTVDVDTTLYPRRDITFIGLAPLTSMYLHGSASRRIRGDYRPSVHDSEGLAILNGQGERIWRPLTNPRTLQSSAFVDKDPKGFGLAQRNRAFTQFEDLEARYEKRPTLWIEPKGGWGDGSVELLEIPADEEIHDNIVAFWRPARPVEAQKPYAYGYRMSWGDSIQIVWSGARVRQTWVGNARKGAILFVLDFDGLALKDIKDLPVAEVRASAGTVQNVVVQRNPETGGVRSSFEVQPQGAEMIELRLVLKTADQMVSESWVYRWTRA